jgi:ABC-type glycerol-3-phosphate transport system substrate-binding protein
MPTSQGTIPSTTRRTLIAVLAGGAALPLALAACGTAGGTGSPADTAAAPPRPGALGGKVQVAYRTDALTIEMYGSQNEEFKKRNPGVQLEYIDVGGNYDTPLLALFAANTPPDAFWLRLTSFASYLYKKMLLNIEPYSRRDAKAAQLDDFFPGILDQGRIRGGLYGLPADGGGPVLFYNVQMFERAGIATPGTQQDANKWTTDAYLDAGKRLTRRGSPGMEAWGSHDPLFHNSVWLAWVWAWGGDFLNKEGSLVALDQAAAVDALQWQQDAITRHGAIPTTAELAQLKEREPEDRRSMFRNARVAMISDWTTTIGAGRLREAEAQGLRWDATLLPSGKAGQFSVSFFHELVVSAATKVPELAWQWAAFQTAPDGVLRRSLAGATQPYRRSVATNPEYLRTLPAAFAKSMAKVGERSRPYPLVVEDPQLQTILGEEIKQLRDGMKSAKDVTAAIKQRFDPLLQSRL